MAARRTLLVLVWVSISLAMVAAVASGPIVAAGIDPTIRTAGGNRPQSTGTPVTLNLNNGEPTTLDPAKATDSTSINVIDQLLVGLVELDDVTAEVKPKLATNWAISPDGAVYTFTLRSDVSWTDGNPVTAEDVRYGILRTLRPGNGYPSSLLYSIRNAQSYNQGTITDTSQVGIVALDATTLRISLAQADASLLSVLSLWAARPMPRQAIGAWGDNCADPAQLVTNGPYRLTEWAHNDHILLDKNQAYFDAANVQIDRINMRMVSDTTAWTMYLNGQLDTVTVPSGTAVDPAVQPEVHTYPIAGTYYYGFSITQAPFTTTLVRKAFIAATDRQGLIASVLGGAPQPALTFTPPSVFGHVDGATEGVGIPYDPTQARQWLADAGYPNGQGLPPITLWFNTSSSHQAIASYVRESWYTTLGVSVTLASLPWSDYRQQSGTGQMQVSRQGWIADYLDASNFLRVGLPRGSLGGWTNATYEALLGQAALESDPVARRALYKQAEEILVQTDAVILPLYYYTGQVATKPYLTRTYPPLGHGSVAEWRMTAPPSTPTPTATATHTPTAGAPPIAGTLYAWGDNGYGQLGNGSTVSATLPVTVGLPSGVGATGVAAGSSHSLATGSDGRLYAWGQGTNGQLGNGATSNSSAPVRVSLPCGVRATAMAAGDAHSLAIGSDGKLYAWGGNWAGQLGNGSTSDTSAPVLVSLPGGVSATAIAAGGSHSLAIGSDGRVYAWGNGNFGQLGNGATSNSSTPVVVGLPTGVNAIAIAAGFVHSLAAGSDGKVYAWGRGDDGQLGNGVSVSSSTPVVVSLPDGVSATTIAAGSGHALAMGSDGKLYGWGKNGEGALGTPNPGAASTPVVAGLPTGVGATALAAGSAHSLAIGSDGTLYAWGRGSRGQLGNGGYSNSSTPLAVGLPGGGSAAAIAAGGNSSLALVASAATPSPTPTATATGTPTSSTTPAPTGTPTATPTASATTVPTPPPAGVPIQAGWTLLALPRHDVFPYTAGLLLADLSSHGITATQIARWQDGTWQSYLWLFSVNDFPIEPGRGYFVKTTASGVWIPWQGPKEPNETFEQAWPITVGGSIDGDMSSSTDVDFYRFPVTSVPTTVGVGLWKDPGNNYFPDDLDLYLYAPDFSLVAQSTNHLPENANEGISTAVSTPGMYYAKVITTGGYYNSIYRLWVSVGNVGGVP